MIHMLLICLLVAAVHVAVEVARDDGQGSSGLAGSNGLQNGGSGRGLKLQQQWGRLLVAVLLLITAIQRLISVIF